VVSDRPRLVVVGGDPVIGGALEVLLQGAGCRARFIFSPKIGQLGELSADYQILLLAPNLSYEYREAVLDTMAGSAARVKMPMIELVPADGERALQEQWVVSWPCSVEELKRVIDTVLLAGL
jgi:hypothetical protein